MEYIAHYGVKRRSGRYPWGSGKKNQSSKGTGKIGDRPSNRYLKNNNLGPLKPILNYYSYYLSPKKLSSVRTDNKNTKHYYGPLQPVIDEFVYSMKPISLKSRNKKKAYDAADKADILNGKAELAALEYGPNSKQYNKLSKQESKEYDKYKKYMKKDNVSSQKSNFNQFKKELKSFDKHPNAFDRKRYGTTLTNEFLNKYNGVLKTKEDKLLKLSDELGRSVTKIYGISNKYGVDSKEYVNAKKNLNKINKQYSKAFADMKQSFIDNGKKFIQDKLGDFSNSKVKVSGYERDVVDAFIRDARDTYKFQWT